jgi:hypothetical protein
MEKRLMASTAQELREAIREVRVIEHNQDLVEVPKRAQLEREAEQAKAVQPLALPEPIAVPEKK